MLIKLLIEKTKEDKILWQDDFTYKTIINDKKIILTSCLFWYPEMIAEQKAGTLSIDNFRFPISESDIDLIFPYIKENIKRQAENVKKELVEELKRL